MEQIPPGILAFKNASGSIMKFDTSGVNFYDNWVKWRMQEPNTIWTIEQDGKRYSVGEEIHHFLVIKSFEWQADRNRWKVMFTDGHFQYGHQLAKKEIPQPSPEESVFDKAHKIASKEAYPFKGLDDLTQKIQPSEAEKSKATLSLINEISRLGAENETLRKALQEQTELRWPTDEQIRVEADKRHVNGHRYQAFIEGARWLKQQVGNNQ